MVNYQWLIINAFAVSKNGFNFVSLRLIEGRAAKFELCQPAVKTLDQDPT